jgi:hypothetical protein
MTGQYKNPAFGYAFTNNNDSETNAKLSEDRYEIYVNNDFIGYKSLMNASDDLSDVDDFLKSQGINEFQSQLNGDHYLISATETERIKDILNVYCQNR